MGQPIMSSTGQSVKKSTISGARTSKIVMNTSGLLCACILLYTACIDPFAPRAEPCPDVVIEMSVDTTLAADSAVVADSIYVPECNDR